MPEPMPTGQRRIELLVREGLPTPCADRERELTEALESLQSDGAIDSYTVRTQDKRTPADDASSNLVSFRAWAHEAGVSLSPSFGTRVCYCPQVKGYRTYDVAPAFCMAVYDGDTLEAVYPHHDGGEARTVMDGIEALSTTAEAPTPSRRMEPSIAD